MNLAPWFRRISVFMALGAIVLAGCSDDSTGPDGDENPTLVIPKAGSTFTSTQQNQDDERAAQGAPFTRTDSLVATNLTIGGKTDVFAFSDGDNNTWYYRYEVNGDVSVNVRTNYFKLAGDEWYNFTFTNEWFTVPFGSKTSRNDTLAKVQNYGTGPVKVPMSVNAVSDHMGTESVTIGGQTFTAQKAETTINVTIGSLLNRVRIQWSFVPQIGYFSKHDFIIVPDSFIGTSDIHAGGSVSTLTSYSLK